MGLNGISSNQGLKGTSLLSPSILLACSIAYLMQIEIDRSRSFVNVKHFEFEVYNKRTQLVSYCSEMQNLLQHNQIEQYPR